MFDVAKLQPVADRAIGQAFSSGLASLPAHDQVLFFLWSYAAMIDNGGFPAFFYNSPADYYPETTGALRQLGLADHAELLEKAAGILFRSEVPASLDTRNAAIDQRQEDVASDEEMERLYRAFRDHGGSDRVLGELQEWYYSRQT